MELYKKPVMKIVELEEVDILTCSKGMVDGYYCTNDAHITHNDCIPGVCHQPYDESGNSQ